MTSSDSNASPPRTPPGTIPAFRAEGRDQAVLEASRAIVALLLRTRSADLPIKELAAHAGLSERTFYRWFPRKEDAIRPYLQAGLLHTVTRLRDAPADVPLRDALVTAHAELLDASQPHGGPVLLAVIDSDERLRAVWLQVLTDAEEAFATVIAERLGIPRSATRARLAGALVVAAGRLALRSDPVVAGVTTAGQAFAACLDLLGPALFAPPQEAP